MSKISMRKHSMHFSPLEVTYTDSRGLKSEEPPKLPSLGLTKAPRVRKKSKEQADELIRQQEKEEEEMVTPVIPKRKRKYGHSVAERKERRRTAREQIKANKSEGTTMIEGGNDTAELADKENSYQKSVKELDFGGVEFDFDQTSIASNGENAAPKNNAGSDTEDESSPVQRRLFTKKRVIEESEESGDEYCVGSNFGCGKSKYRAVPLKKAKSGGVAKRKVGESDEESNDGGLVEDVKGYKSKVKSSKNKQSVVDESDEEHLPVEKESKKERANSKKKAACSKEVQPIDEYDAGAHGKIVGTKSKNPTIKLPVVMRKKVNRESDADKYSGEAENELCELDFSPDEQPNKVNNSRYTSKVISVTTRKYKKQTKVSRQAARCFGKSVTAKSPYAQELYARAAEAEKAKGQETESREKSESEVKLVKEKSGALFRKKSTVKKVKAHQFGEISDESEGDSIKKPKLTRAKKTAINKTSTTKTAEESDDKSGYHPMQNVKRVACEPEKQYVIDSDKDSGNPATNYAAYKAEKQDNVDSNHEESNVKMSTQKDTHSKRVTAKNDAATIKSRDAIDEDNVYQPSQNDLSFGGLNAKSTGAHESKAAEKLKENKMFKTNDDMSSVDDVEKKKKKKQVENTPVARSKCKNTGVDDDIDNKAGKVGSANQADEEPWGEHDDDALFQEEPIGPRAGGDSPTGASKDEARVFIEKGDPNDGREGECSSQEYMADYKRDFVMMSTRPISDADMRDLRADLQEHTYDSEPSSPSHSEDSKVPLSAVSISDEKNKRQSVPTSARPIVVALLGKLEEKTKLSMQVEALQMEVNTAKQQVEDIDNEINALASSAKLALARY